MASMLGYYARMNEDIGWGGPQFVVDNCCPGHTPNGDKRVGRRRVKRRELQQLRRHLQRDPDAI
jgi:hypothetical protein